MEELNQPEFIERLKQGHESAYRDLNRQLFPYFLNYLMKKYEIDREDAKDIVQDVARRIIEKINQYDLERGKFIVWAFRILRNITIDWFRKKKKIEYCSLANAANEVIDVDLAIEAKTDDLSPIERLPPGVRAAFFKLNDRYQQFLGLLLSNKTADDMVKILKLNNKGALYTLKSRVFVALKQEIEKTRDGEI